MPAINPATQADKDRFIKALENDINSGMHASETNDAVIRCAIRLIQDHKSEKTLSLEQLIRGTLNYALASDSWKYCTVAESRVGKKQADLFNDTAKEWFDFMSPSNDDINAFIDLEEKRKAYTQQARSIIAAAAQSPLFIVPGCMHHTLIAYFDYAKKLDAKFPQPELPGNHCIITSHDKFNLLVLGQQVNAAPIAVSYKNNASKSEAELLDDLKRDVDAATRHYVNYSKNIWFSVFHHHGKAGRDRAQNFCELFKKIDNYAEAKKQLTEYLNDKNNGNTHPHSYRTMLLAELGRKECFVDKASYKIVSTNYQEQLKEFTTELANIKPAAVAPGQNTPGSSYHGCGH